MSIPSTTTTVNGLPATTSAGLIHAATPSVTLADFLRTVFGDADPWLCAAADGNDRAGFFGARASKCNLDGAGWTQTNNYYCIGVLKPGAPTRANAHWESGPVVVIDDVGEKTDADKVRDCLGEPSFVVQSSPGSQQWGYLLVEPITDADVMAQMQKALTIKFFGGIDPGQEALVRYMRLPCGVNNKPTRVSANGGTAPAVYLASWEPGRRFFWQDMAEDLGDAWDHAAGAHTQLASHVQTLSVAEAIERGDYIIAAFEALGMIKGAQGSQGYIEVVCPWEHTHTKADDRTGWNPELFLRGQSAFKCHHSDNGEDTSNDGVERELRSRLGAAEFDALRGEAAARTQTHTLKTFASALPSDHDMMRFALKGMATLQAGVATATQPRVPTDWVSYGLNAPQAPIPQRRRICDGFARGEVTYIAAQPATGKSAIGSVAFPLAMSAGRADLVGEPVAFERTGDVYLVSNEDNADMVRKRAAAWMMHCGVTRADLRHDTLVNKVQGFVAVQKLGRDGAVELGADMIELGMRVKNAQCDVAMVILDTQAAVFSGINENDNGEAGAVGRVLTAWAKEHNVSLVIVHHMPKANGRAGGGGDQGAVRGAGAYAGMMRNQVTLVQMPDELAERLRDQRDRDAWVIYEGGKANHSAKASRRWFRKHIVNVPVEDERNPGAPASDPTPVFVYDAAGPDFGFDPNKAESLFQVTAIVCDALNAGTALRVRAPASGDMLPAPEIIAERLGLGVSADDARKALKNALKAGLVEEGDGPRNASGNYPKVYRPTQKGAELVEERRLSAADMDAADTADDLI
jgi:hypothetical protein